MAIVRRCAPFARSGAGAVVNGDVPEYAFMAGNSARRVGWISGATVASEGGLVCLIDGSRHCEIGPDELVENRP